MRKLLVLTILLLLPTCSWAACVGPTQADVVSAVAAASAGETVQVCVGTATWETESSSHLLTITKGIKLEGGIGGTTTLTLSGASDAGQIYYAPDADNIASNATFELTGFTLNGGGASKGAGLVNVTNSHASTAISNIKIHHNTFVDEASTAISISGLVYGVIYLNTFTDVAYPVRAGAGGKGWTAGVAQTFGQATNIFVEDNTINATKAGEIGMTDPGQGAPGFVYRYNTTNLANSSGITGLWAVHGLQMGTAMTVTAGYTCGGTGYCGDATCSPDAVDSCDDTQTTCKEFSTVKNEIYGNSVTNGYPFGNWFGLRGGASLMFYNSLAGSGSTVNYYNLKYSQFTCDSCQSGGGAYVQHITKTYNWANYAGATLKGMVKQLDYCGDSAKTNPSPYTITENTDFWNHNGSFDGTAGIGCGALGSRPETCTLGTAYWATAQSCSDISSYVGASTATPLSGTLYICGATGWADGSTYTPYSYPHPLRGNPHTFGSGATHSFTGGSTITWQ